MVCIAGDEQRFSLPWVFTGKNLECCSERPIRSRSHGNGSCEEDHREEGHDQEDHRQAVAKDCRQEGASQEGRRQADDQGQEVSSGPGVWTTPR